MKRLSLAIVALSIHLTANAQVAQPPAPSPSPSPAQNQDPLSGEVLQLRDPFKRPVIQAVDEGPKTPLEEFPSDQFRMVGVISGGDRLRAILLDPNGKTHFVSEKMKIGQKRGVIFRINNDSMVIREKVANVLGREESLEVQLRLPDETLPTGGPNNQGLSESRYLEDPAGTPGLTQPMGEGQ